MPESEMDKALTQHLTRHMDRWCSMAIAISGLKTNLTGLGTGDGMWSLSDEDVH